MFIEYSRNEDYVIVSIVVNNILAGFTVTDNNLERLSEEIFETAADAIAWANKHKTSLLEG